jgi:hypothetical protein
MIAHPVAAASGCPGRLHAPELIHDCARRQLDARHGWVGCKERNPFATGTRADGPPCGPSLSRRAFSSAPSRSRCPVEINSGASQQRRRQRYSKSRIRQGPRSGILAVRCRQVASLCGPPVVPLCVLSHRQGIPRDRSWRSAALAPAIQTVLMDPLASRSHRSSQGRLGPRRE